MRKRCHHSGNLSYVNQELRKASRLLKNSTRDADMDLGYVRLGDEVARIYYRFVALLRQG